jgi:tetratricopeptide (TPR) repeat protein
LSQGNRWDLRTAIEMLRHVTALDPGFADAWARLAEGSIMMAFAFEPEGSWLERAEEAIERALTFDPSNRDAQILAGRALWTPQRGFKDREALRALGEALRGNPNSHHGQIWQAAILFHVGLLDEARGGLSEALAMHPDDPFALNLLGQTLEFQGDFDTAEDYQMRALALDPTQLWGNLFLPSVLIRKGELDRAMSSIRTAEQVVGSDQMLGTMEALVWARRGEGRKAEALVEKALADTTSRAHVHHAWHNAAGVYALLEKPKQSTEWLGKAARGGLPNFPLFDNDAHLDSIRDDPGFEQLMLELHREWDDYRREFSG